MRIGRLGLFVLFTLVALSLGMGLVFTTATAAPSAQAAPIAIKVQSPQGAIPAVNKFAPRLSTLEGKKIALWLMLPSTYEFQPAGLAFYERIAELLKKQFPGISLITPDKFDNAPETKSVESIKVSKPDVAILGIGG